MSPYSDPIAPNYLMRQAWGFIAEELPQKNLGGHFPSGGVFKEIEHLR
jgi:hypothetical protein